MKIKSLKCHSCQILTLDICLSYAARLCPMICSPLSTGKGVFSQAHCPSVQRLRFPVPFVFMWPEAKSWSTVWTQQFLGTFSMRQLGCILCCFFLPSILQPGMCICWLEHHLVLLSLWARGQQSGERQGARIPEGFWNKKLPQQPRTDSLEFYMRKK